MDCPDPCTVPTPHTMQALCVKHYRGRRGESAMAPAVAGVNIKTPHKVCCPTRT